MHPKTGYEYYLLGMCHRLTSLSLSICLGAGLIKLAQLGGEGREVKVLQAVKPLFGAVALRHRDIMVDPEGLSTIMSGGRTRYYASILILSVTNIFA